MFEEWKFTLLWQQLPLNLWQAQIIKLVEGAGNPMDRKTNLLLKVRILFPKDLCLLTLAEDSQVPKCVFTH